MSLSRLMDQAEWKIVGAGERLCRASLGREDGRLPRLGVVLAAWDPAAAAQSVDLVLAWLRSLRGAKWSMVVVANNKAVVPALGPAKGEYTLVAGSNREAEFSAYEEGRHTLVAEAEKAPDVWVILNDRLPFYKADCLCGVTPALLQFASSVPIAAGTIDFLPRYFDLWGQRLRCYIRSNYILVSGAAIDRAGSLCAVSADDYALEVPTAFPGENWPLSAWIGPELGESLRIFLTVPGGVRWTRAEPLTAASWPRLRMKALSIVNEWLFSLRLIGAQVPIVPWRLARAMSRLGPHNAFLHGLLEQYRTDPGFGGGLEAIAPGRLQLAAAVLAARAGATKTAETFLSSAAKSSTAARTIRPAQGQRTW
jgi:hypothetical protein